MASSIFIFSSPVFSQEEGTLTKKARVTKGKSFYFMAGPSFQVGKNKGDYSGGLNLETGFLMRLNRILSIGPSISFTKFDYDESISDSFGDEDAEGNNIFIDAYEIKIVYMEGGDLKFFSLGFDVKVDFIPGAENKRFIAYGFTKPFLLLSSRSEVSATVEPWYMDALGDPQSLWYYTGPPDEFLNSDSDGLERWGADTEFSGGLNIGIGAEYALPSGVAFFLNTTIGLMLPITYINTSEFEQSILTGYYHPDYPFVKKGLTTFNILAGVAYRF